MIQEMIMHRIPLTLALTTAMMIPAAAQAAPNCTSEPRDKWMSEETMKAKVATLGYEQIKTFKVSGSCYEIYGYTKDGKKAEVYFNPVSGDIVKSNIGG
jgi:hypothetical protein